MDTSGFREARVNRIDSSQYLLMLDVHASSKTLNSSLGMQQAVHRRESYLPLIGFENTRYLSIFPPHFRDSNIYVLDFCFIILKNTIIYFKFN